MKNDALLLAWDSTNGWGKLIVAGGVFLFIIIGHILVGDSGFILDPAKAGMLEILIGCLALTFLRESHDLRGIQAIAYRVYCFALYFSFICLAWFTAQLIIT